MNRIIWSIYVVGNFLMVTDLRYWWQNHYVGDFFNIQNRSPSSQIGDQHLKPDSHQQKLSPTSVTNNDVIKYCHGKTLPFELYLG